MKPYKIALALLLTFALLIGARRTSTRNMTPVHESVAVNDLTLTHTAEYHFKGDTTAATIAVSISGGGLPEGQVLGFYYRPKSLRGYVGEISFSRLNMQPKINHSSIYEARLPNQGRGSEFVYFIQLEDANGNAVANIPPSKSESDPSYLWFRFEGLSSLPLLLTHILLMFGGFLFFVLAFLTAFENLQAVDNNIRLGKQILWAVIIIFLGTFPIGIWLEHQVYGTYWTGIPLGRDKTDSKTMIIFLYWLILLILVKGSAFKSNPARNILKPISAKMVTIVGFLLTAALYLIPHSSGDF